jgi:hypothetical protein
MSYRRFKRKSGYCPLCNRPVDSWVGFWKTSGLLQMKPCGHCNEKCAQRHVLSTYNVKASLFILRGQRSIVTRNFNY